MKRFAFKFIGLIALICTGAQAQGEMIPGGGQCALEIKAGDYTVSQTTSKALMDAYKSNAYVGSAVVSTPANPVIGTLTPLDSCKNEFKFKISPAPNLTLEFIMEHVGKVPGKGLIYYGKDSAGQMTFELGAAAPDPDTLLFQAETKMKESNITLDVSTVSVAKKIPGPLGRVECDCKPKLEEWIRREVDKAERFKALFANPDYRHRPPNFPPTHQYDNKWTGATYKEVIKRMFHDEITFEVAAELVLRKYFPDETLYQPKGTAEEAKITNDYVDQIFRQEKVDWSNCQAEITPAPNSLCYKAIEAEAIQVHAEVHMLACESLGVLASAPNVEKQSFNEIQALQAEIDYLKNWIPNNCS